MIGKLLRLFGYLFSGGLCLGMIGLGFVSLIAGPGNLTLEMIPWWTGYALAKWLVAAGVLGLLSTFLAATGRFAFLQFLWMAVVLGTLVYGFYFSNYTYDDWEHFKWSLYLSGATLLAFLGAITGLFAKPNRARS